MELSDLKGIGPKRLAILKSLNINTFEDLLRYYPTEYLDYDDLMNVSDCEDGVSATLKLQVTSDATTFYYKGRSIVSVQAKDETGKITLRWINQPFRANQFHSGMNVFAHGRIRKNRGLYMYNPTLSQDSAGIVPVYNLPKGITQALFRSMIREALECCTVPDSLGELMTQRFGLMQIDEAVRTVHFPLNMDALDRARKRIQLEQAFFYFLAIYAFRENATLKNGFSFHTDGLLDAFISMIPYSPTKAQLRVMKEVESDMHSMFSMNRLVQGDVGCGKTLIAEFAMYIAAENDVQSVFLVPTEILAEQHYRTLNTIFSDKCELFTSSIPKKEKQNALKRMNDGSALIIIGTHALLSENIRFKNLGLIVTDEQHRFGVEQRAKIEQKGIRPDVLVMSATPIPRTLALLLYSDLRLSVVDEMPSGRIPVKTMYVSPDQRLKMYRYIGKQLQNDERAFVICPVIEETDGFEGISAAEVFAELTSLLPNVSVGFINGQMNDDQKNDVMKSFRDGKIQVLVSTTVVEVGVDIPQATYMVIEGSQHFGLATLHQLRGRIGRGTKPSCCFLLCTRMNDKAKQRIEAIVKSNDGFYLAQRDLELRGYGDLLGIRQSGESTFSQLLHSCPADTLETASSLAKEIMGTPSLVNNDLINCALRMYGSSVRIARN